MFKPSKNTILALLLLLVACHAFAQNNDSQFSRVKNYFENYSNSAYSSADKIKVEDIQIDLQSNRAHIYLNEAFQAQPFTPSLVHGIYDDLKRLFPAPYNTYTHIVYAKGTRIELLIPADLLGRKNDSLRTYNGRDYHGNAWVTPKSRPYNITNGLQGRHLCVWQSHGRFYNLNKQRWEWQRPYLFCTTEDLFTQTVVVPYLIPMLERAGAVVYTPR
ncbi:MAG: hypothetical protein HUK03_03100, partial [Bacteroidaceae bacterium]|nr:hypothetical protein [Bacteroidaceae bacterium]